MSALTSHGRGELIDILIRRLGGTTPEGARGEENVDERDPSDIGFRHLDGRRCRRQRIRQEYGIVEQRLRLRWNGSRCTWSRRRRVGTASPRICLNFPRRVFPRLVGIHALIEFTDGLAGTTVRTTSVTPLRNRVSRRAVMEMIYYLLPLSSDDA